MLPRTATDDGSLFSVASSSRSTALWWGALALVLDLATKAIAPSFEGAGWIEPVENDRWMLGTPSIDSRFVLLLAVAVPVAVVAWTVTLVRERRVSLPVLAFLGAGFAGNLVDRAIIGPVRDWLAVGPVVLNVADVYIFVALAAVIRASAQRILDEPERR